VLKMGSKYHRLTVIEYVGKQPDTYFSQSRGKQRTAYREVYKCECECGMILPVQKNRLTSGNTKSCGCQKIESCTRTIQQWNLNRIM
jgi:hypothetical protein